MGDVLDRRTVLLALALLGACAPGEDVILPAGRPRAEALLAAWAHHLRAGARRFDAAGDAAFGTTGLHYDAGQDVLFGRVFVSPAYVKKAPANELNNYRRVAHALNDPAIGGMFDRAGGYFVLEESREAYFLVRPFPVARVDDRQLIAAMEQLQDVAAMWTGCWFRRVAMIVGGHEPPPTRPITLDRPD